ncbi:uncharacterized protein BX663DRAFT_514019 [Cokeromyces recurvatus]|uniref:uncharacterized protein n=1 Tax=Cokeromyces recurvatus TaxID=90255 RepID=UPI00221F7CC3|nr:uncharacterized protein BX663DRAFT_514019 [Cokeromyces recurvatus]KAI7901288.1 hypothetical protein BX663DRAFT_514019 [Cokeromyces recurvatus]
MNSFNERFSSRNLLQEEGEESSRTRGVDIYRLAVRANDEILEDLAAIIRILRQINALYRILHHTNRDNFELLRSDESGRRRTLFAYNFINDDSDEEGEENKEEEEEEETNELLEAGLESLQAILTCEEEEEDQQVHRRKQSTLALLSLITYQHNHCSEKYLRRYLNPNGEYNPKLAILAAAIYDEDEDTSPKSCQDIILAAEELYGPDWLEEFDDEEEKEGFSFKRLLEKLTFVAKIRLKVRDANSPIAIR